jgi:hypothetical protein
MASFVFLQYTYIFISKNHSSSAKKKKKKQKRMEVGRRSVKARSGREVGRGDFGMTKLVYT